MSTTEQNLVRLAGLMSYDQKQLAAIHAAAHKLTLQSPKRKAPAPSANSTRLQNAVAKHGANAVHNKLNCDSIQQIAASKFAALAIGKAGR